MLVDLWARVGEVDAIWLHVPGAVLPTLWQASVEGLVRLRLIISGGQTGADKAALVCARELGIATGGTVPLGCRTDVGPDRSLVDVYGCRESLSAAYPPRTRANVENSDATVWFGNVGSPGYKCTRRHCLLSGKPFIENPASLRELAERYVVINVAGNRARTNPHVVSLVRAAFRSLESL